MTKRNKNKKIALDADAQGFSSNPFATALFDKQAPPQNTTPVPHTHDESKSSDSSSVPAHVILRRERKGRGGKVVTCVEGVDTLDATAQDDLAKRIKKMLGCGARMEGEVLVVQGDQVDRLATFFQGLGVARISH